MWVCGGGFKSSFLSFLLFQLIMKGLKENKFIQENQNLAIRVNSADRQCVTMGRPGMATVTQPHWLCPPQCPPPRTPNSSQASSCQWKDRLLSGPGMLYLLSCQLSMSSSRLHPRPPGLCQSPDDVNTAPELPPLWWRPYTCFITG